MRRLAVIKLGGSIVTDKDRAYHVKTKTLEEYATVLSSLSEKWRFIVIVGGGSFGHYTVRICENEGAEPHETLHTVSLSMMELAMHVADVFGSRGIYTMIYPPHAFCKPDGLKPNCDWDIVLEALKAGLTPIIYGDIYPCGGSYRIVSGDELAVEAACSLKADVLLFATSVAGVLMDGRVLPELDASMLKDMLGKVGGSASVDVTGGMRRKLEAILRVGCPGLEVYIFDGRDARNLAKILEGLSLGTRVHL